MQKPSNALRRELAQLLPNDQILPHEYARFTHNERRLFWQLVRTAADWNKPSAAPSPEEQERDRLKLEKAVARFRAELAATIGLPGVNPVIASVVRRLAHSKGE